MLDSQRLRERALQGAPGLPRADPALLPGQQSDPRRPPSTATWYVVRTRTQSAIAAAWRALQSGQSFSAVARRYSIEYPAACTRHLPRDRPRPGGRSGEPRDIAARPNVLSGPVAIPMGYYIFKVKHIAPGRPKPLSALEGQITAQLVKEREQAAVARASDQMRGAWKPKTHCSPGYVIVKCAGQQGEEAGEEPLQPRHFPLIQNFI